MERTAIPAAADERRSPTPAAARKREALRYLKAAMAERRIVLHYQPIVRAGDWEIENVEALLRWKAPDAEVHELEELIRAAERSPVIFKLEHWTLGEGLRAAAAWRRAGATGLRVNVNLSAREFVRPGLVGRVGRQLRAAGLDPRCVALEVTETSAIHEFGLVAEHLDQLIAMGIELWLDDFGTGHSSLDWLSHLPIHGVKIAGTFVERVLEEKPCQVIVTRVIEMAHDLGVRVTAEGVENEGQRGFLVEKGCDSLQGFLFHAAMPAEDLGRVAMKRGPLRAPDTAERTPG
jgi:EAL domain-containing protein (putative c-di-GMP-specific phosphodiesterase class I)